MNLKINRESLQSKYALEVYKMVDGYPSTIDILYELVTILEERNALDKPFTSKAMMKEVNTRVGGKDLEDSLAELSTEGWLEKQDDSYQLVNHPWIKN